MINVSDTTKQIYQEDSIPKHLKVEFPNLSITLTDEDLVMEKFNWEETIFDGDNLEFVGCIASTIKLDIIDRQGRLSVINDELITVSMRAGDTEEIPLFYGYVASTTRAAQQYVKSITAYDILHKLADVDVTDWYSNHTRSAVSVLLDDLLTFLNVRNNVQTLVNGSLPALCHESPRKVSNMSALNLLKAICQINGCCGRIGRTGAFETVSFNSITPDANYPSMQLFPSNNLFPVQPGISRSAEPIKNTLLAFYKTIRYDDYFVNPVDSVTLRNSSEDTGITAGYGYNNYIIQGNIFAYDWSESELTTAATNILNENISLTYMPFESDNNGLPFIECGDFISCYDVDYEAEAGKKPEQILRNFCVLHRSVSGINNLRDYFEAEGNKDQRVIISDLGLQISDITTQVMEVTEQVTEVTEQVMEVTEQVNELSEAMLKAVSVESVPTVWDPNTIYFIRK